MDKIYIFCVLKKIFLRVNFTFKNYKIQHENFNLTYFFLYKSKDFYCKTPIFFYV